MSYFQINDIEFDVPPSAISWDHVDQNFEWKTLRSSGSTKIKSGRGHILTSVKLVILPAELWKLHRLLVQFKNTPFWYVRCQYLRDALATNLPAGTDLAFCAKSMVVGSISELPNTFEVELQLIYFNYCPFSPTFGFKKDWHIQKSDGRFVTLYNVPVQENAGGTSFSNIVPADNPFSTEGDATFRNTSYLRLEQQKVDLSDLLPLPVNEPSTVSVTPERSDLYKLYVNYLQAQDMERFFQEPGAVEAVLEDRSLGGLLDSNTNLPTPIPYRASSYIGDDSVTFRWKEYAVAESGGDLAALVKDGQTRADAADVPLDVPIENLATTTTGYLLPISGGRVTSPFGPRVHPVSFKRSQHNGVDLGAAVGTAVVAPANGSITRITHVETLNGESEWDGTGPGGLAIYMMDDSGYTHEFMHLDEVLVSTGRVIQGQVIARSGNSGTSTTGPHLHWGIKTNSSYIDPMSLVNTAAGAFFDAYGFSSTPKVQLPPALTPEEKARIENSLTQIMQQLALEGWRVYQSPHVANVLVRDRELKVVHGNGIPSVAGQLVCTSLASSYQNEFAHIPILGQELPTSQFMGGTDNKVYLNFASITHYENAVSISEQAKELVSMIETLERQARQFRRIPDSWIVEVDNFITKLSGQKTYAVNRLKGETVPGSPGLYTFDMELTGSSRFANESLQRNGMSTADAYNAIIKILLSHIDIDLVETREDSNAKAVFYKVKVQKKTVTPGHDAFGAKFISIDYVDGQVFTVAREDYNKLTSEQKSILVILDQSDQTVNLGGTSKPLFKNRDADEEQLADGSSNRNLIQDVVGTAINTIADLGQVGLDVLDSIPSLANLVGDPFHTDRNISDWTRRVPHLTLTGGTESTIEGPAGWDVVYWNTVDVSENYGDWLNSRCDELVAMMVLFDGLLSDNFYGGYSREELQAQAPFFGLEKWILPSYEKYQLFGVPNYNKTDLALEDTVTGVGAIPLVAFKASTNKSGRAVVAGVTGGIGVLGELVGGAGFALGTILTASTLGTGAAAVSNFGDGLNDPTADLAGLVTGVVSWDDRRIHELKIIQYCKELLTKWIQQNFLNDSGIPRLHPEFSELLANMVNSAGRTTCYPDLRLPAHPFFRSELFTNPDFYLFSYGSDNGAELRDSGDSKLTSQMNAILVNSKESLEKLQRGEFTSKYFPLEYKEPLFFEGAETITLGHGKAPATYRSLRSSIANIESNFRSIDGFSGEVNQVGLFEKNPTLDHKFDIESLKLLAEEAVQDLDRNKLTFKRAFPTFKLYFIEEDKEEQGWRSLDDFYSYNAIRSITVTRSRKIPADLAVIELQNVSGVLDGSLNGAITDLDYSAEERDSKGQLTDKAKRLRNFRNPVNENTTEENFFNSIVLREGLNIQLKLGSSNNPDLLTTVLNGRIVQVEWSENGDLATIVIQSFATELAQCEKGITSNSMTGSSVDDNPTLSFATVYENTTDLLSSMLKSPEVLHFGKWEYGKDYQLGETLVTDNDNGQYKQRSSIDSLYWYDRVNVNLNDFITSKRIGQQNQEALDHTSDLTTAETLRDIASYSPYLVVGSALGSTTATKIQDLLRAGSIVDHFDKKWRKYSNNQADDNVYGPNPDNYVDYGIFDFSGAIDKRDIVYQAKNTTIWDIFQEMTYRHPGWIAAPRPYGSRMTMFFGVPSQRYWAEDVSAAFIERMNQNRQAIISADQVLTNPYYTDSEKIGFLNTQSDVLREYLRGLKLRFRSFRKYHLLSSYHDIVSNDISVSSDSVYNAVAVSYNSRTYAGEVSDLVSKNRDRLLDTVFSGPSLFDAKSRAKSLSASGLAKSIGIGIDVETKVVKYHDLMDDEDVNMNQIAYDNCNGPSIADRYGLQALTEGLREMYKGSITVLGDPTIAPNDLCLIMDDYNDMAGPIEVEEVTHIFTPDTGFISVIVPDAFVVANELSSQGLFESIWWGAIDRNAKLLKNVDTALRGAASLSASIPSPLGYVAGAVGLGLGAKAIRNPVVTSVISDVASIGSDVAIGVVAVTAPSVVGATVGTALVGAYQYFVKPNVHSAATLIPLVRNGKPMTAGIPEDLPENMFSSYFGQFRSWIDDAEEGFLGKLVDWKLFGYNITSAYNGELTGFEKLIVNERGSE